MFGQSQPHFLLTRPLLQSRRFAAQLTARFGDVPITIAPLMQPLELSFVQPKGPFDAVIFTSETGVAFARGVTDLPPLAYCVGDHTAKAARAAGFDAISAKGDWRDLLSAIGTQHNRLLYLHAQEASPDLPKSLIFAGIDTVSVPIYCQEPLALTPQACLILAQNAPVIAPIFSARSARLLGAHLGQTPCRAPILVAALSAQVAQAIGFPVHKIAIATAPNGQSLIGAISQLL